MRLSPHFTLDELTVSEVAARLGIDNSPPSKEVRDNLRFLAQHLERVRSVLGDRPIIITSGYRCPELNGTIGGSPTSAHVRGLAADFICPSYGTPYEIVERIADSDVPFDQLIHEYGRWVHLGLSESAYRHEVLTICRGTGYVRGLQECP